jgi:hypothetical protein
MTRSEKAKQGTPRSERRTVLKKALTGPTLLEMSGNPTYQDLAVLPIDPFLLSLEIILLLLTS